MNINAVSTNINAALTAEELATLKAAIAASGVITLPEGKTLDDVPMFQLRQIKVGTNPATAVITGQIK